MALVEFVNDQPPYLNANNLNNNFNELDNKIDGIIESGSNANGSWIKYNDGTMIQYGKSITGTTAYTTAYGNGYYDNAEHTVTFPIEFYNDNVYVSSIAFVGFGLGGCSMTTLTKTSFNYYMFSIRSYTFSSSPYITWIAIGRWK